MYDIMVLLRSKKMVEMQFQALLHAPALPKGESPPKKREVSSITVEETLKSPERCGVHAPEFSRQTVHCREMREK